MAFTWAAIYTDGRVVSQYDATGTRTSTDALSRSGLRAFAIYDHQGKTAYLRRLLPGQCFFYRRRVELNSNRESVVVHLIGLFEHASGDLPPRLVDVTAVYEGTSSVEVSSIFQRDHPWLYEPAYVPADFEVIV